MKQKTTFVLIALTLALALALSACQAANSGGASGLTASGTIASDHIRVAPEVSGKVLAIHAAEGDRVQAGDVLFTLDDELPKAQAAQAQAAVDLALVSVDAASAQLASAQAQYDIVLQQARLADLQNRSAAWSAATVSDFTLPAWYFERAELRRAAQAEVDAAMVELETELANLDQELQSASNEDFIAVETRLAQAQAAFATASQTLLQAKAAAERTALEPAAEDALDAARSELDDAQLAYDRKLSATSAEAVLEARARVAVARARLDNALDSLAALQTGEDSLQAAAGRSTVAQAETAVRQAQANLGQAQAALSLANLAVQRCTVAAPADGVILSLGVEVGELVQAGTTLITLGQLDQVNLTVYVPEDQYGRVSLGQQVSVSVDSFAGRTFSGEVAAIADEAEFTPRNVQTVEGRKTTVYAVRITLENGDRALKPGMPADVDFNLP